MREFFHGWRRKLGCVTLVMAITIQAIQCARNSGALREDMVLLSSLRGTPYRIIIKKRYLQLVNVVDRFSEHAWMIRNGNVSIADEDYCYNISYPSLVLPITLVSAYLILWKPRKKS